MILNLTPHDIDLVLPRTTISIPPSGRVAEVDLEEVQIGHLFEGKEEIPILRRRKGRVRNLPLPREGVWLVVSNMVLEALPEREDLLSPAVFVRDQHGRIVGCRALTLGDRELRMAEVSS